MGVKVATSVSLSFSLSFSLSCLELFCLIHGSLLLRVFSLDKDSKAGDSLRGGTEPHEYSQVLIFVSDLDELWGFD
jgi:hypothetical protein